MYRVFNSHARSGIISGCSFLSFLFLKFFTSRSVHKIGRPFEALLDASYLLDREVQHIRIPVFPLRCCHLRVRDFIATGSYIFSCFTFTPKCGELWLSCLLCSTSSLIYPCHAFRALYLNPDNDHKVLASVMSSIKHPISTSASRNRNAEPAKEIAPY